MTNLRNEMWRLMGAGRDISEHLGPLLGLAMDPDVKQIGEFGFRTGVSTTALCRSKKPVITYDPDMSCKKHVDRIKKLGGVLVWRAKSSLECEENFDLLHIDSLHTYDQILAELTLMQDRVAKWIACHDTVTFPPVLDGINDWLKQAPEWEEHMHFRNNNGFMILKRRWSVDRRPRSDD